MIFFIVFFFFKWIIDLDNENDDDSDMDTPTADCWFVRQSKQEQQSSIVIVAYDQFNAVNQQVDFEINIK